MSKFNESEHVINAVAQMKNVEVKRVFSVDYLGEVKHCEIVFRGKLMLVEK